MGNLLFGSRQEIVVKKPELSSADKSKLKTALCNDNQYINDCQQLVQFYNMSDQDLISGKNLYVYHMAVFVHKYGKYQFSRCQSETIYKDHNVLVPYEVSNIKKKNGDVQRHH